MNDDSVEFTIFDVEQAYLSTAQVREVYVGHPPGYKFVNGKYGTYYVKLAPGEKPPLTSARLLLALYGGIDCGRLYYDAFMRWHVEYGFQTIHYDKCYIYLIKGDSFIKMCFHVDDGMVAHKGKELWQQYLKDVQKRFKMVLGRLEDRKKFLGNNFHLDRERGVCYIEQSTLIDKMLDKFDLTDCNPNVKAPISWPLPTEDDCPQNREEEIEAGKYDMESAIGFFNFLVEGCKPEMSGGLKRLSRFAKRHGAKHRALAKHMMRWCKKTRNVPLVLRGITGNPLLQIFTDASHASCPDTRKSITGLVFKLNGSTIFWKCLFQKIISHSSTESELIALDKGATIGQYIKWMIACIGKHLCLQMPVRIFIDNQGAQQLGSNPIAPDRNLHIHARFFYIRDLVEMQEYIIEHLSTHEMVSDILCTFKGSPTFHYLYMLLINVAKVVMIDGEYRWMMNSTGTWRAIEGGM